MRCSQPTQTKYLMSLSDRVLCLLGILNALFSADTKSLMSPSDRVLCLLGILNALFSADTNKVFDVTIGQSIVSDRNLAGAVLNRHRQRF